MRGRDDDPVLPANRKYRVEMSGLRQTGNYAAADIIGGRASGVIQTMSNNSQDSTDQHNRRLYPAVSEACVHPPYG